MTTNLIDEYRRTSYEISEAIAPGWYRRRPQFEAAMTPVRDRMVRALALREGATVLELAAGAGDTGFTAAADADRLICTDFSPAMLDVARRRAEELDIRNVDFRAMDAEHLDLDTASVDGVLCRFGFMLMADPAAALAQTHRVLRPGGRLALAVWAAPARNPFFSVIAAALAERGHLTRPPDGTPNPFSMADPDRTTSLLRAAGFDPSPSTRSRWRSASATSPTTSVSWPTPPVRSPSCSSGCPGPTATRSPRHSNTHWRPSRPTTA